MIVFLGQSPAAGVGNTARGSAGAEKQFTPKTGAFVNADVAGSMRNTPILVFAELLL